MNPTLARGLVGAALLAATVTPSRAQVDVTTPGRVVTPSAYVVEYVASAAFATYINDAGVVVGTSYPDPGCGSTCLPPLETVVWRDGRRIVLPGVPGLSGITVTGINNDGWVVGYAGFTPHAVVWKPEGPTGATYRAFDLGVLPGKTISTAAGIDDMGRVVGWSTTSTFPANGSPFMWTEEGGMVDLGAQGFPVEEPLGISPGGTVATYGYWYRLGQPGSVVPMPPPPAGWAIENSRVAINDAGDQARFLITGVPPYLDYPFRFRHEGSWQLISNVPTGPLSRYGIGSINARGDISLTVASTGMIARGPAGMAQPLAPLVTASYGGGAVTGAGEMNARGEILARMLVGQSARLVRLVPARACTGDCIRVASIQMTGQGPAYCDQGQAQVQAQLLATNVSGVPIPGVQIIAQLLDDYWMDRRVVATTDNSGVATLNHTGPACVGAIALLVTDATSGTDKRLLDRSVGTLARFVIPLPRHPADASASSPTNELGGVFELAPLSPNPARHSVTIRYVVPEDTHVRLTIFNALGREVARVIDDVADAGDHEAVLETSGLPAGTYLVRLSAGNRFTQTRTLVVVR